MNRIFILLIDIDDFNKIGDIISVENYPKSSIVNKNRRKNDYYVRLLKSQYHRYLEKIIIQDIHQTICSKIRIHHMIKQKEIIFVGIAYFKSKEGWQLDVSDEYLTTVEISLSR